MVYIGSNDHSVRKVLKQLGLGDIVESDIQYGALGKLHGVVILRKGALSDFCGCSINQTIIIGMPPL